MLFSRTALISLLAAPLALASPLVTQRTPVPPTRDAPFTVSAETAQLAITCPHGIQGRAGGVVLLVHGTGSTGPESWQAGPWTELLPNMSPGFDVCWITMPGRTLGDAQVSSEYVARGVQFLAPKSKTGKVSVVGHSQGNLNIQWALTFWPNSVRSKVKQFISLAGDFKGTLDSAFACPAVALARGCSPSLLQQATNSRFLRTLDRATAGSAVVPTASIYTLTDEIITPEIGPGATSVINKASLYPLQAIDICGPLHLAEHFSVIIDPAAFEIGYKSLAAGYPIPRSKIDKFKCIDFYSGTGLDKNALLKIPELAGAVLNDITAVVTADGAKVEPPIAQYAQPYAPAQ